MKEEGNLFGLRLIHGAMISMGLRNVEWPEFVDEFQSSCGKLSAWNALKVLSDVFGKDRPFLLLIDELSKADDDVKVMESISYILTHRPDADVIVSALSPNYVAKLTTPSQRKIKYCIIGPLLNQKLGAENTKNWTDQIITELNNTGRIISRFEQNFLNLSYILYSGHPRSLEDMATAYKKNVKEISEIFTADTNGTRRSLKWVVEKYLDAMGKMDYKPSALSALEVEDFVFKPSFRVDSKNAAFRNLIENGNVFLYDQVGDAEFIPAVKAYWILQMIRDGNSAFWKSKSPKMKRCRQLLPKLPPDISEWWERFIDITIVCRSFLEPSSSICDMFGISDKGSPDLSETEAWNLEVLIESPKIKANYSTLLIEKTNSLIVPKSGNSGFDSLVMLHLDDKPRLFYNQVKIDIPKNKPFEQLVCDMICYNLLDYFNTIWFTGLLSISIELSFFIPPFIPIG
jgi:hypothetical protein